jgi:hypothetical protein
MMKFVNTVMNHPVSYKRDISGRSLEHLTFKEVSARGGELKICQRRDGSRTS